MRITLLVGSAACAGVVALVAPAAAMPVALGQAATAQAPAASSVEKVEFLRYSDGRIEYRRPRFNDKGPYFFAYRGYAYPYYPGYTYRLTRGKLKPYDRPHRYRIAD